jgi:hypothetical protein
MYDLLMALRRKPMPRPSCCTHFDSEATRFLARTVMIARRYFLLDSAKGRASSSIYEFTMPIRDS